MKPFLVFLLVVLFIASLSTILLWGVNVVASIIGTVLAATLAMVIGFSGNLMFGLGTCAGAAACALFALLTIKRTQVAVMGDRQ
ncbi:MAG TPA: hypothetical protein VD736_07165 [Nitrososphaera sp.]|nr:hypothetical protein [Nitrososphaera sp.]